jgi:hypothetical protein
MKNLPILLSAVSLVCTALLFVYVLFIHSPSFVSDILIDCKTCQTSKDAVQCAAQLGRLDLVSILLTLIGIILALCGLFGFWILRSEVVRVSEKHCLDEFPKVFNDFMKEKGKEQIEKLFQIYYNEIETRFTDTSISNSNTSEGIIQNLDDPLTEESQ